MILFIDQSIDDMGTIEVATVRDIYKAGGRVKIIHGDNEPLKEVKPGEKPMLKITVGWYFLASHGDVMTVLQRFLNDIKGGLVHA